MFGTFAAGTMLSFFLFIALIPITFVVKKAKAVGIVAIVLGVVSMAITNFWGIVQSEIIYKDELLYCNSPDSTSDCEHTRFATSLIDVAKYLQEK
jgi:hypothetical protein